MATPENIYKFEAERLQAEKPTSLSEFKDKVLLIVNVASKCGYTGSNYKQLSELAEKYDSKGLKILLFPCNQFGKQEPGTVCQIKDFSSGFSDKFIMFNPINVNGKEAHELFKFLKETLPGLITNSIKWNFTKFLVNRDGIPIKRYAPNEEPMSFEQDIVNLLQQKDPNL